MIRQSCGWLAIVGLMLGCAGCGKHSQQGSQTHSSLPEGYVAPRSTDNLPLVDHPEYVNWSQFPVGTFVVRKKEVTNDFGLVRVTTKLRLSENTADRAVVESQVTVDRPGEALIENPPQEMHFAAKFRLPAGMNLEQFSLPALRAKQVGEESLATGGRDFKAQVFAWDERNETGRMAVKLWRCNDVPGRMLRQEIEGHQHHSMEEVSEIVISEK